MTEIPRQRLVATDQSRNGFVSSFKAVSSSHVKLELLDKNTNPPTISLTPEGHALIQFETDLSVGDSFVIYRQTEIDASDIYVEGQPLRAASLNAEHRRISMILQEVEMRIADTIQKSDRGDDSILSLPPVERRKNKFLYFDDKGGIGVSSTGSAWVRELEQLKQELRQVTEAARVQIQALELPLSGDQIAERAITKGKIDPSVRLGGPALGTNSIMRVNDQIIEEDIRVADGTNAGSFGPVTIKQGNTVTLEGTATWRVV